MSDRPAPNPFDARIKSVFRHFTVARDLIIWHLALKWPPGEAPDPSRIEAWPQEWIATGPDRERRLADPVWHLRDRDERPQLAVRLECQSRYAPTMSGRMARYTLLLGQALARQGLRRADGRAAPILPAVFPAGPRPWLAPWERLASPPDWPQAALLQPGLAIDIHAYADDDERPPRDRVSCMIGLEQRRHRWAHEDGAFARLLRYVDEPSGRRSRGRRRSWNGISSRTSRPASGRCFRSWIARSRRAVPGRH